MAKRAEAENKLAEANDALRLFNKLLRHDLLNQLTVIKGRLGFAGRGDDKEVIHDVLSVTDQSLNLIKHIGLLEAGVSSDRKLKAYEVLQIIENMKDRFPEVEIVISGEGKVLADEALESVIENIIRNAKLHGKTKKIAVKITGKNNHVHIAIADFGKGIPKEIQKKLFTEGFKYGRSGHSGLGLYIAQKNISRWGGQISVGSNKPKGAVFNITLPRA